MAREYFETQKERQMKLKKINAVLGLLIVLSLCGHAGTMGYSRRNYVRHCQCSLGGSV